MTMRLRDGPFSQLEGRWAFAPLGDSGCEVSLRMEFEFAGAMQDMLFGGAFESICNEMIGAFIKRADALYGTA
jgi:ribosome-associated toxin RatA of RatAB toxin-antitoxin module